VVAQVIDDGHPLDETIQIIVGKPLESALVQSGEGKFGTLRVAGRNSQCEFGREKRVLRLQWSTVVAAELRMNGSGDSIAARRISISTASTSSTHAYPAT